MNELPHASFLDSQASAVLLPQDTVVIGGTSLLEEFFQIVAQQDDGELAICTAFIDEAFTGTSPAWAAMSHTHIDLRIVTRGRRDAANAWSALRGFPWRSAEIWQCQNLHAKVYSFISHERGIALVGSHNLTRQGLVVNIEAGVLFKVLVPNSQFITAVLACQEHVNRLVQHSRIFVDTKRWPRPDELGAQEDSHD
jgi:phosphatidylserine/phosphatidylglycerophosphate/cardiolipin synthase-like enzyme